MQSKVGHLDGLCHREMASVWKQRIYCLYHIDLMMLEHGKTNIFYIVLISSICMYVYYMSMIYVGSTFTDLAFCDPVNDKFDNMYNSLYNYFHI